MIKHETLTALLDRISEHPAIRPACRHPSVNIDPSTFWSILSKSNAGDPRYILQWGDLPPQQFAALYVIARKRNVLLAEALVRDQLQNGSTKTIVHEGRIQWAIDPVLASDAMDPAVWKMLHGDRPISDVYARDENGGLVPATYQEELPAMLRAKILTAMMPQLYSDTKRVEVSGALGVTVIADPKPKSAPAAVQAAVQEAITDQTDDDGETEQQEMAAPAATPMDRPDIAELRRLAAMSPADRAAASAAAGKPRYRSMSDRAEGIGAGEVRPGGYRVSGG